MKEMAITLRNITKLDVGIAGKKLLHHLYKKEKKYLRDKAKNECYDTIVTSLCCLLIHKM